MRGDEKALNGLLVLNLDVVLCRVTVLDLQAGYYLVRVSYIPNSRLFTFVLTVP